MAYDKKYPEINKEILEFDKGQEDRTEQGFNDLGIALDEVIKKLKYGTIGSASGKIEVGESFVLYFGELATQIDDWSVILPERVNRIFYANAVFRYNNYADLSTRQASLIGGNKVSFTLYRTSNPTASISGIQTGSYIIIAEK